MAGGTACRIPMLATGCMWLLSLRQSHCRMQRCAHHILACSDVTQVACTPCRKNAQPAGAARVTATLSVHLGESVCWPAKHQLSAIDFL